VLPAAAEAKLDGSGEGIVLLSRRKIMSEMRPNIEDAGWAYQVRGASWQNEVAKEKKAMVDSAHGTTLVEAGGGSSC